MKAMTTNSPRSLDQYVSEINRFPLLSRDQEQKLAKHYVKSGDLNSAHQLVVSNLRFVVKIAHEYRSYGLPLVDLVQEGNIGLMKAVKKFDPEKGYRLISYAVWWIRAYMQNFVLNSWSLVKIGTTQAQRKLFFKLRSAKEKFEHEPIENSSLAEELACRLKVKESEVLDMELRLAGKDYSLDVASEREESTGPTLVNTLEDTDASPEAQAENKEREDLVQSMVHSALNQLNDKERFIVHHRLLSMRPKTLHSIGKHFGISRERARQIESNVLQKLKVRFDKNGLGAAALA